MAVDHGRGIRATARHAEHDAGIGPLVRFTECMVSRNTAPCDMSAPTRKGNRHRDRQLAAEPGVAPTIRPIMTAISISPMVWEVSQPCQATRT